MTTATTRPIFDPVDTTFDPAAHSQRDDVESPSLSDSNALARFEFEPGRSKDGTKVLMVEWEDDDTTRALPGDWEIRWEGKRTVLPGREPASSTGTTDAEDSTTTPPPVNRLYFLLGPGVSIPTTVRLQKGPVSWRTNPLPAIFSPELGATARQAGRKGVLHTIWAKKRVQTLQHELAAAATESSAAAGVAARDVAARELDWIEQNFGVGGTRPAAAVHSPTSPRSPGAGASGRLMDRLKGLKIATGGAGGGSEFGGATLDGSSPPSSSAAATASPSNNPLSPDVSDVAIGSFSSFALLKGPGGASPTSPLQHSTFPPATTAPAPARRPVAVQRPPEALTRQQQQQQHAGGMGSLNAAFAAPGEPAAGAGDEDDLFALPMSPRSPDMAKSPFSFAAQDIGRYSVR